MKKAVKFLSFILVVAMSLSFISCNKNSSEPFALQGRWYHMSESFHQLMLIKADGSVVTYRKSNRQFWNNISGVVKIDGDKITITFEDGNNVAGTFSRKDNVLTISTSNGVYVYNQLASDTNVVGKWNIYNVSCDVKAIKDEVELPSGTMNDGAVVPTSLKTADMQGRFVEFALERYMRNIEFTNDGKMLYDVLKEGNEIPMSKNYQINDISMNITGETAGYSFSSQFKILQVYEGDKAAMLLSKENMVDLMLGYSTMLYAGGVSPEATSEQLAQFKQSFLDAFEYFDVTIRIERK